MRRRSSDRLTAGDRSLRAIALAVTWISMLLILFPFVLTISNAMKDNVRIYDVPPGILPSPARSLSIVVDYDGVEAENLEAAIRDDMVSAMFGVYTRLSRSSIFETRFYGVRGGKTVFYARAHQIQLQMEKDYGIYKGTVLKPQTLLYRDRAERAARAIGYAFGANGLADHAAPTLAQAETMETLMEALGEKFPLRGHLSACNLRKNNALLLESFVHYMKLPQYIYGKDNPRIATYGFMAFVGNTVLVIGFAILAQLLLCSVSGFVISRLLQPRAARLALMFFLGAMMIPFVSIMIPQLIMYREMGAYNNYAALLLPFLYPYGFYVYLFKGFFDRIPHSYFEAARLDGASNLYLYASICMPLSKPIIALIALQVFLGNWNDFFWAWLVTEKQDLWTLNVALYNISNNVSTKQNALMGIAFVTILPVILLSLIFSKQLKESIMASGVKG
ncbi:MAG: carbohydrate ABC transporter permease [Clostridiales bacterium]|nr:carbohydrate ABC transporter permease [Clostridiales bacterium]